LVSVADRHLPFARQVAERLNTADFRSQIDGSSNRMNAKIRDAQLAKIPYILVIGDREVSDQSVSVRLRTGENLGAMPVERFAALLPEVVARRLLCLQP